MVPCTSTSDGVHETGLGLRELHEMYYNGAGMMSSLAALLFESREARVLAEEKAGIPAWLWQNRGTGLTMTVDHKSENCNDRKAWERWLVSNQD